MKSFILLLMIFTLGFASSLQNLAHTFSQDEKVALLKEFSNPLKLHIGSSYQLKEGWNKLLTPQDGVNVVKTFHDTSKIKYVVTYYKTGKLWAIYAQNESFNDMLFLKYLEPNVTFFVLAKKDSFVEIESNHLNSPCQALVDDVQHYGFLTDSGISREYTLSDDKKISLQSRYYSHHDRGIYNDTRVTLIYPKLKSDRKRGFKYGPAIPKIAVKFTKAYEGKQFYVYDYKDKKCYKGVFPSLKIPPFPVLEVLR